VNEEQRNLLILAARTLQFATDHPYAATGIFGAAVGSFVTYRVMTIKGMKAKVNGVFTPKVYEFAISKEDLNRMLVDPEAELRWDLPTMSFIVTSEKREQPKLLPDISVDIESE
jgi:hypothetical protein